MLPMKPSMLLISSKIVITYFFIESMNMRHQGMVQRSSTGDNDRLASSYRIEIEHPLRLYDPVHEATAAQLLDKYAGMELERVMSYRHFNTGKNSFCVAVGDNLEAAGLPRVPFQGHCSCYFSHMHLSAGQATVKTGRSSPQRQAPLRVRIKDTLRL